MESRVRFWNLCRVLANETRLKLLWCLFDHKELCVRDLQVLNDMSRPNASNQLKLLSASGLISSRRERNRVIYRPQPLREDGMAAQLLKELRRCSLQDDGFATMIHLLTGFTHGRRIEIVQAVAGGCVDFSKIMEKTGMSGPALSRHLDKLDRRGFVCRDGDQIGLRGPSGRLGKKLMDLALRCV